MIMTTYQDMWVDGKAITKGYRDCEHRYDVIKNFCKTKFSAQFSVCDIGANMCYFGIRLAEDFGCNVVAFEFHNFMQRRACVSCNKVSKNILFLNHKLQLREAKIMCESTKFDLVLALSVLHHVTEPVNEWEDTLKLLGRFAIVEYAALDSKRVKTLVKHNGTTIGWGDSHLDKSIQREIVVL
jgi:2-polyprenyl-3-methyl-5-hydroxy-6-metoxy-1,4-benzoquinol methylase